MAAKVYNRGLGRVAQGRLSELGLSVNVSGRVYERATGRFASFETVSEGLESLNLTGRQAVLATTIKNKIRPKRLQPKFAKPTRGMFTINYTKDFAGKLSDANAAAQSFDLIQKNRVFITNLLMADLVKLLPLLQEVIRARAQQIVQSVVYDSEVEVIYYTQSGKPRDSHWSDYEPTGHLMMAVVHGIRVEGLTLTVQIDDDLAPYWLWVERGHRVILPGGDEPGIFVVGRPFVDKIYREINRFLATEIGPLIHQHYKGVIREIGQAALQSRGIGSKFVENFPSRGYGNVEGKLGGTLPSAFNRFVGLRR